MAPDFEKKRKKLVEKLKDQDIVKNKAVIEAMLKVPRERFIPEEAKSSAYIDTPLSIGENQTISAPHMVAMMLEILDLKNGDRVLEVGTGSGYHAALCAELVSPGGHIYTIERHENLAEKAEKNLREGGYQNVTVIHGDGTLGYPEEAPYDKVLVTAASPNKIPQPLKDQLKIGGVMCIPAGTKGFAQNLYTIKKVDEGKYETERITGVRFVPLIGKHGFDE
ncbi:MAG: protein-L-isoaspartate(D-aspartate) O-methyltransferase [Promethearchaeota archaeon]|nr:MAG: protein-L-isoaspartate(D-aspartate) O-methyltransferase [Candidatus Lokiarchaeota archaeon]